MSRAKKLLGFACCALAAFGFIGCAEESPPAKRTATQPTPAATGAQRTKKVQIDKDLFLEVQEDQVEWAFIDAASSRKESPPAKRTAVQSAPTATGAQATKKVALGKNVFLEIQGDQRRVLLQARVCLRQGQLEQFLTRAGAKEHEAILAVDTDASIIHAALIAAGAEPGKPVQFRPKYQPASGSVIKIRLIYQKNGKSIDVPAQQWVRDSKTKKDLAQDWVFGGSFFIRDPLEPDKKPYYAANDGDVICVSNFETALLDLPIESSQNNDDLSFEANTERIPPLETPVMVVLEPVAKKK